MQLSSVRSVLVNAGWLAGARALTVLARLLYIVVLAKYLGPALYGLFAYGQSWYFVFLAFATLGLTEVIVYEVGRDRRHGIRYVGQSLSLYGIAAVTLTVCCAGLGMVTETDAQTRQLLTIFALALPGRIFWLWAESTFRAYEVNHHTFKQEAFFRGVEILSGLLALALRRGIFVAALLHTVVWWLQGLSGLLLVRQQLAVLPVRWPWRELGALLQRGMPILAAAMGVVWLQQGPLVLYRHTTATLDNLGQLSLVMQAFLLSSGIFGSAVSTTLPVLSRAVAQQDGKVVHFVDTSLRVGLLLSGALGIAGLGLGQPLVLLLFGSTYAHAGALFGFPSWFFMPWTLALVMWQVLLAHGQSLWPSLMLVAGAAVMTGALPILVPVLDAAGALLATGLGIGTWLAGLLLLVARLGIPGMGPAILRPLSAVLVALGCFVACRQYNLWLAVCGSLLSTVRQCHGLHAITPQEYAVLATWWRTLRPSRRSARAGEEG